MAGRLKPTKRGEGKGGAREEPWELRDAGRVGRSHKY